MNNKSKSLLNPLSHQGSEYVGVHYFQIGVEMLHVYNDGKLYYVIQLHYKKSTLESSVEYDVVCVCMGGGVLCGCP